MIKLALKLLLFLPILLGMMYFSYKVDPAGLFWGADFERQVVEYMLDGKYVRGYERLDGRELNEIYARQADTAPQVLINGSSRVMLIDSSFTQDKTFYNAGNTGADIYDIFSGYYIFSKEGKEPQTYLIGVDPWIFNDSPEAVDRRSNKELYYQFLSEEMGYTFTEYVKENPYEKYKALIEPSYFQSSVNFYLNVDSNPQPEIIDPAELYNQSEVVKCPDGSVVYYSDFYFRPQEVADGEALTLSTMDITRVFDFRQISPDFAKQFEDYLVYLQGKGIKVILYLPPYHHYVYWAMQDQYDKYHCVFEVEDLIRKLGEKYGIQVYGSYDPDACGLTNRDFMDGLHIRPESIKKIIPVIE